MNEDSFSQPDPAPPLEPRRSPDPREIAVWIVLLLLVGGIFAGTFLGTAVSPGAEAAASAELVMQGRYALGVKSLAGMLGEGAADKIAGELLKQLDGAVTAPADRLPLVILTAELAGPEEALEEIAALEQEELSEGIRSDLALLGRLYGTPPAGLEEDRLSPWGDQGGETLADFRERRGWFAKLALVFGRAADDPERNALVKRSIQVAVVAVCLMAAIGTALLAGVVLLSVGIVLFRSGKLRLAYSAASARNGLPFLEMVVVLIVVVLAAGTLAGVVQGATGSNTAGLAMTLLAAITLLWPTIRGVPFAEVRRALGWQRGEGFLREAGWGLVGYLAGIPVLGVAILISLVLSMLMEERPYHPIFDSVGSGGVLGILVIYLVASVSAPIVEETVFRGGFYHYLRARLGIVPSALAVSLIFAGIHPQGILGIPPLVALAMILAFIREWRGSLIAPIVVHAVHNGIATTVLLLLFR